jgi:hypothetical protein
MRKVVFNEPGPSGAVYAMTNDLCDDQRFLSSDGESPISIAVHGDLLYVLNVESKPHHRDCIDRMDTNKVENLPKHLTKYFPCSLPWGREEDPAEGARVAD